MGALPTFNKQKHSKKGKSGKCDQENTKPVIQGLII